MASWRSVAGTALTFAGQEEVTDEEIDYLLWNETCFPFGTLDQVVDQLETYAKEVVK